MNFKISVVIVSYNVCDYVIEGIESLYKFSQYPLQIILVDNNSTDNTLFAVRAKFPEVLIIENKENVGFSAANNQGFKLCTGKYVLLFNPDAALVENSFDLMIQEMEKREGEDVLLGTKLINTDDSVQTSCWKFPSPIQHLLELFFLNTLINTTHYNSDKLNDTVEVDFISGALILMNQNTLAKLKGLDVNLFWMDDVDLCKRNIELGGKNIYFPYTKIKHHIGKSSKKNQNLVISNQIISKLKFYKKHKQLLNYIVSIPIFFLQIISRILIFLILGFVKKTHKVKFEAYCYTLGKFFNYLFLNQQLVSK